MTTPFFAAPTGNSRTSSATAVTMLAMIAIGATSIGRWHQRPTRWIPHIALAAVPITIGALAHPSSPVALIVALAALCVAQLGVSLSTASPHVLPRRVVSVLRA